MPESTHTPDLPDTPSAFGWCAWHQGYARGVRLITAHDAGSGPGAHGNAFACRSCRQAYDLVPLADQSL